MIIVKIQLAKIVFSWNAVIFGPLSVLFMPIVTWKEWLRVERVSKLVF